MSEPAGVYRVGTLSYTKPKLFILFCWLLWGDFCYMLMETGPAPLGRTGTSCSRAKAQACSQV